ncbi:MAG: hypothetical protein ACR2KK_08900 [Acidimicrobiales bacterium]
MIGPLFAEDLLAGCRVDVFDGAAKAWQSLCRRKVKFDFLDPPAAALGSTPPPPLAVTREGLVEVAATGTDEQLATTAALATWEGWSLSAPKPGRALRPDSPDRPDPSAPPPAEMIDTPNVPPTRLRVGITSTVEPGTLPRLRFGHGYRLRARAVDLAGNSLPFQPQELAHAPDTTREIRYARFEPVPSPVVVLRKEPGPGESAERLVVRSVPARRLHRGL